MEATPLLIISSAETDTCAGSPAVFFLAAEDLCAGQIVVNSKIGLETMRETSDNATDLKFFGFEGICYE